ncbi:MAG: H-X9-DG-CTERM domain-containing protein, partial [Armatimonadia bacterium]
GGGASGWAGTDAIIPKNSYMSPDQTFCAMSNGRIALGAIDSPADTIMFTDTNSTSGGIEWFIASGTPQMYADWVVTNMPNARHNDGRNYGFADGHAKWLKAPSANMFTVAAD